MITDQVHYKQATDKDIAGIVKLHKAYIAGEDLKKFQDLYLDYYYQEIVNSNNFVFIAVAENNIIGFCSLVADQSNILRKLIRHKYHDIFKIPLKNWIQVLLYSFRNLYYEVLGGKWSDSEISKYRSCIELRAIAVDPEYRKSHVGTNLLGTCLNMARKTGKLPIIAWVSVNNEPSFHLFLKNGFQEAGVRRDRSGNFYLLLLNS